MKAGTQIEVLGHDFAGNTVYEAATICRPRKSELPLRDGYHVIRFADGGKLCAHESRMRVASKV
jgi:hypothetical protein